MDAAVGNAFGFHALQLGMPELDALATNRMPHRWLATESPHPQATFAGATELAIRSDEPPCVLRERVTSKGGTTHAALASMQADGVQAAIVKAIRAAQQRAQELGQAG